MSLPFDHAALPSASASTLDPSGSSNLPEPGSSPVYKAGLLPWAATWIGLLSISAVINAFMIAAVHGSRGFFLSILATMVCVMAGLFDAWTHRIPNFLTYTGAVMGLGLNLMTPLLERIHAHAVVIWLGAAGARMSLLGVAVCAGVPILLLPLIWRIFGRDALNLGDLKVMAAVGAILGLIQTANVAIFALAAALLYSVINLAAFGRLTLVVSAAAHRLLELIYLRRLVMPMPDEQISAGSHIPMAVPMAMGAVACGCWQFYSLHVGAGP